MRWKSVLSLVATLALAVGAASIVTGGFVITLAGVQLSAHAAWRPLALGLGCLVAIAVAGWRRSRAPATEQDRHAADRRIGRWFLLGAATYLVLVVAAEGSFVAGGADASGYVSQSELWARGRLQVRQPMAERVSWPEREWMFAPLGYRPATIPLHMVPTYAPGLPLLMSWARTIAGDDAVFVVVPAAGLLLLLATYGLGRDLGGMPAGVLAVTLIATSPTFLHMVVQPMSDVPAAAFWTMGLLLAWKARDGRQAALAGLVAGLAILVRPNLAPLAALVCLAVLTPVASWRQSVQRMSAFTLGLLPGVVALAGIQWHLYGSPFASGYGQLGPLFDRGNIPPNIRHYGSWLLEYETAIVCLGVLSPLLLWPRASRSTSLTLPTHLTHLFLLCLTLFTMNVALYLPYIQFDDWAFLRFFLPGLAVLSACGAAAVVMLAGRFPRRLALASCSLLVVGAVLNGARQRPALDVFGPRRVMQRFLQTATYVQQAIPPDAVLFCMEHSGSL
ncbi:MAG TPA: glycosyltransferase family 39 protein, partial [Chloroflexota bacterium]|nr:glycosyltransferase family 39 protein [Chloroflexota bacterium]